MPPKQNSTYASASRRSDRPNRRPLKNDENNETSQKGTSSKNLQQVCNQYQTPRGCHRGKDCKFQHVRTPKENDSISNAESRSRAPAQQNDEAAFKAWRYMVQVPGKPSRNLGDHQLSRFFSLALDIVSNRDPGNTHQVITLLATDGGLSRIVELATGNLEAFADSLRISRFETLFLPFLRLVTHEDVISSLVLENPLGTIYNCIFGVNGRRAVPMFKSIAEVLFDLKFNVVDKDDLLSRAMSATLAALAMLIDINQTAAITEGFKEIAEMLTNCLGVPEDGARNDLDLQSAMRSLDRIRGRLGLGLLMANYGEETTISPKHLPEFVLDVGLPGRLAAGGPRHDNDHANIVDIQILPTADEIQSNALEYLPVRDLRKQHINGMGGLLDRHFRLLREDTVGQLRDGVRHIMEILRDPQQDISRIERSNKGNRVYVYHNVSLVDFEFDKRKGLRISAEFDQPFKNQDLSTGKKRAAFWSETKQMQIDSFLCLVDSDGKTMFLTVAIADREYKPGEDPLPEEENRDATKLWDNRFRAVVELCPADPTRTDISEVLQRFRTQRYVKQVLVEFPGVLLPAFHPTLTALQQMSQRHETPFSKFLVPPEDTQGAVVADIPPPLYSLQRDFQFALGSISDGHSISLSARQPFDVRILQTHSSLDNAQCAALIHALTRSLACIQGPPGTGKSYVGIKTVKVLLSNRIKAKLGPIFCICYTNHALDQILEGIVADGNEQIIRLGAHSKSEILEPLNLHNVTKKMEQTKTEKHVSYMRRQELDTITSEANGLLEELRNAERFSSLKTYLEANNGDQYRQLFGADEDGFQTVRHNPENALNSWLNHGSPEPRLRTISVLQDESLFEMSRAERKKLHAFWIKDIKLTIEEKLHVLNISFKHARRELEKCYQEVNLRCLQQAHVIGVTTTGLAKNLDLLRRVRAKVLLCEEAGEVQEAHILTELRPQIQNHDFSVENPNGVKYSLNVSLFERLVRPVGPGLRIPYSTLETQRRMHPSIAELVRQTLYPRLEDHLKVAEYPEVSGMRRRLYWLDHREKEAGSKTTSHSNDYEVEMAAALVSHLVRQGTYKSQEIAILTPYLLQLRKLRNRLASAFEIVVGDRDLDDMAKEGLEEPPPEIATQRSVAQKTTLLKALRVATVDNFQGEEADVVIISLVRSNDEKNCGFLKTSNRINVLLSRARHGMYIIGNSQTSRHVTMWHEVLSIFERNNNIGPQLALCCYRHPETLIEVSSPDDFVRLAPEGGCNIHCEWRLACGHSCINKCHSQSLHNAVVCLEPCQRSLPGCDHSCPRHCGRECVKNCGHIIRNVILPCRHTEEKTYCYQTQNPGELIQCRKKVDKKVPGCGHMVTVDCCIDVNSVLFSCNAVCNSNLPCGHACLRRCHECQERKDGRVRRAVHGACATVCDRPYTNCAHGCSKTCHNGQCGPCQKPCEVRCQHSRCDKKCCEPCAPCAEPCDWACEHSGKCDLPCAVPCDVLPCSERCQQKLSCDHQCPSLCGEICPTSEFCQICASEKIRNYTVDYIMGTSFAEVDLDESPVIIPNCGHMMTVESFDGQMAMSEFYDISETGAVVGHKTHSEPFSSGNLKKCPQCRGPLRNVRRYGRIVKRGMIDEATKKFIIWANEKFLPLVTRLHEQEQELEEVEWTALSRNSMILTAETLMIKDEQFGKLQSQKDLPACFKKAIALQREIGRYLKEVSEGEQPFGRIYEMVQDVRRRRGITTTDFDSHTSSQVLQTRNRLLATALNIRCALAILSSFVKSFPSNDRGTELKLDFEYNRQICSKLCGESISRKQPMHEVESRVYFARFVALERFSPADETKVPALLEQGREMLRLARTVCERAPSTHSMLSEIEEAEKSLRESTFFTSVTNEEKRAVYAAMATSWSGTGHWYNCPNGHPFTVGECGGPMQESRCPQCDAVIGGRHHIAAEGVTIATEFEREFGRLRI